MDKCWYKGVCQNKCSDNCIRYLEMSFLMESSKIPEKCQYPKALTPESCDYKSFCMLADIKDDICSFVSSGGSLYINSANTGNGKTSWAIKLMLKYFNDIWAGNGFRVRGLFINVPTFLTSIKNNISNNTTEFQEFLKLISEVDLVIWDDIASTALSQYDHSQLLTYIDFRVLQSKSNIYTGNITDIEQLKKSIGIRLSSRVWNNSVIITLYGKDRRNGTIANNK